MLTQEDRKAVAAHFKNSMEQEKKQDLFACHVTEDSKKEYFKKREIFIADILEGKHDGNLTVMQRAYYLRNGVSVALLPMHGGAYEASLCIRMG